MQAGKIAGSIIASACSIIAFYPGEKKKFRQEGGLIKETRCKPT